MTQLTAYLFPAVKLALARLRRFRCVLLCVALASCTSDKPADKPEQAENLSHPDYRAIADELITDLPTIITENDFKGVVDSTTMYQLSPIVARLNDSLGRLAVLHQIYDTASSETLRSRVNLVAIPFRIIADRTKTMVQSELPANRQYWFHTFLEQRTSAAGLPHDVWSIEPGSPTQARGILHDSLAAPHRPPRDSGRQHP